MTLRKKEAVENYSHCSDDSYSNPTNMKPEFKKKLNGKIKNDLYFSAEIRGFAKNYISK